MEIGWDKLAIDRDSTMVNLSYNLSSIGLEHCLILTGSNENFYYLKERGFLNYLKSILLL